MNDENKPAILIVDDNPTNLGVLFNYLRMFKTFPIKNVEKALKLLQRQHVDLILLDIMMPDIDGYEMCRRLKNNPATQDIPVIFMSALSDTVDKVKGFQMGAVDYITKPFQQEEVLARIKVHIQLRTAQKQLEIKNQALNQAYKQLQQEADERENIKATLRQSRAMLRAFIDNLPSAIFVKNVEGCYLLVNQQMASIAHLSPQQMVGKTDVELFPAETIQRWSEHEQRIYATGEALEFEEISSDGDKSYLATRFPIYDAQNEIYAIGGITTDITERKQAEIELEAYRHNLEKLVVDRTYRLESIATLSGLLNMILDVNQLLTELVSQIMEGFGFDYANVYLLEGEGEGEGEGETGELVIAEGAGDVGQKLKEQEYRLSIGQGIIGHVAATNKPFMSNNVAETDIFIHIPLIPDTKSELAVPLRKAGKLLGVLDIQSRQLDHFTSEDVSMIQSLADQTAVAIDNVRLLTERQATIIKLQEVDQAKSQFITMMSHELRTPLNAINGFSELLMLGISGELPSQAQGDVQLIYNNGQHLLELINGILDISMMESGQIQIAPESLDPMEIIGAVLESLRPSVKDKPISIVTDIPETLPSVYADQTRLKQILLNLAGNAIKFTKEGIITISVRQEAENMVDTPKIRFSIRDTGIGIPVDKVDTIFVSFQQADMSDARSYGGTGLGLTICKQLVELHGGEIGVQSEEGVGSEFWFTMSGVGRGT
ncbi:ATP-binding protein [Anaerolineales bacterium HSG24]|nr:ATP-binding protein [Anaerolineales bacterium HSG24]